MARVSKCSVCSTWSGSSPLPERSARLSASEYLVRFSQISALLYRERKEAIGSFADEIPTRSSFSVFTFVPICSACCRRYLATMANKYQPFIPQPFVHMGTLGKLRSLPYRAVRKNLEFHRETDCSVSLAGTVDEMAARLKKLLKTR